MKRDEFYCKSELRTRGWTEGLIKNFMPVADGKRPNPFRSSQDMLFYSRARVEAVEQTPEFCEALAKAKRRQAGAEQAGLTKTRRLLDLVKGCGITVFRVAEDEIRKTSYCTYAGNYQGKRFIDYPGWSPRTAVNCIRHNYTNYDAALRSLVGKVGKAAAYEMLKDRVLDEIAEVYPEYADECFAQKRGLNTRHCEGPDGSFAGVESDCGVPGRTAQT